MFTPVYLSNRYEHAKVQLLLIKFNTRTPGKKHTLRSSDVETFGVLGTTLIEICYVKFKVAKPRCRAKIFFYLRDEIENFMQKNASLC